MLLHCTILLGTIAWSDQDLMLPRKKKVWTELVIISLRLLEIYEEK